MSCLLSLNMMLSVFREGTPDTRNNMPQVDKPCHPSIMSWPERSLFLCEKEKGTSTTMCFIVVFLGMFSACAYGPADPKLSYDGVSSSQNIHVPSLATLRYQRPIISPARFQPTAVERTLNLELPKNVGPRARAPCGILSKTENSGRFGSMSLLCSQPLNQISSSSGRK